MTYNVLSGMLNDTIPYGHTVRGNSEKQEQESSSNQPGATKELEMWVFFQYQLVKGL